MIIKINHCADCPFHTVGWKEEMHSCNLQEKHEHVINWNNDFSRGFSKECPLKTKTVTLTLNKNNDPN